VIYNDFNLVVNSSVVYFTLEFPISGGNAYVYLENDFDATNINNCYIIINGTMNASVDVSFLQLGQSAIITTYDSAQYTFTYASTGSSILNLVRTVQPTPTPTPTRTPLPTGYQTAPWNFTTYIKISGAAIGDPLNTWTVSQFDASPSLAYGYPRITYKQTYNSTSESRFTLQRVFDDYYWSRRDAEGGVCVSKLVSPALTAQTITKLPGTADGWGAGEEYTGSNITFYVSGFN
jgi:hypothetical protein